MSDLPTRYDAAVWLRYFSEDNLALYPSIVRAYRDGRLVKVTPTNQECLQHYGIVPLGVTMCAERFALEADGEDAGECNMVDVVRIPKEDS